VLVHDIVQRLVALRYVDDARLAMDTAESAARRGHGSEYVRAALGAKGVAESLIEAGIDHALADEVSVARRVMAQRYAVPPCLPAERAKAARFLLQRGFPESVVLAILGEGC